MKTFRRRLKVFKKNFHHNIPPSWGINASNFEIYSANFIPNHQTTLTVEMERKICRSCQHSLLFFILRSSHFISSYRFHFTLCSIQGRLKKVFPYFLFLLISYLLRHSGREIEYTLRLKDSNERDAVRCLGKVYHLLWNSNATLTSLNPIDFSRPLLPLALIQRCFKSYSHEEGEAGEVRSGIVDSN